MDSIKWSTLRDPKIHLVSSNFPKELFDDEYHSNPMLDAKHWEESEKHDLATFDFNLKSCSYGHGISVVSVVPVVPVITNTHEITRNVRLNTILQSETLGIRQSFLFGA